jgi:molybdate transport system substrate-binding protein
VRRIGPALLAAGLLAGAACGSSAPASGSVELRVLAAASLKNVFPMIGDAFTAEHPGISFESSFAGTDQLAAQIEQGVPADVFAGASLTYGDDLMAGGFIEPFSELCTNRLVVVTPRSNPAGIRSPADLDAKPLKLVIGSETVPIGTYTRTVLHNLDAVYGAGYSNAVLANVVSNEDSVTSIMAKVFSGEADAGFVYVTDAQAAELDVLRFDLPEEANATAIYPVAIVSSSDHRAEAARYVQYLLSPRAQVVLVLGGFGPAPVP